MTIRVNKQLFPQQTPTLLIPPSPKSKKQKVIKQH